MDSEYRYKLVEFFSKYKTEKFKKGNLIVRQGQGAKEISLIKSGYVRAFTENIRGEEMTLPILKPVFYTTLISAMLNKGSIYNLEAMGEVELWTAPKDEVIAFFKANIDEHMEIMKQLIWSYADLTVNLQRITAGDAYERVAIVIEFLFRNFGEMEGEKKQLDLPVPHRLIGTMTGLSRETVTLQILKMVKAGLVTTKNRRISLKNESKLKAAAGIEK